MWPSVGDRFAAATPGAAPRFDVASPAEPRWMRIAAAKRRRDDWRPAER
jgi:hypothetical protein